MLRYTILYSIIVVKMGKFWRIWWGLLGSTGELDRSVSATVGFLAYDNLIIRNTLYVFFFDR